MLKSSGEICMSFARLPVPALAAAMLFLAAASAGGATAIQSNFGTLPDGAAVDQVTLSNEHGVSACVIAYGATLQSLVVPDSHGAKADIVLGYATLSDYVEHPNFFGVTVGRYANRIKNGMFTLDGKTYRLARNNGPHSLHGGTRGFDKILWSIDQVSSGKTASARLSYVSPNGEEGYPGTLHVSVTYGLTDQDELSIAYDATSDAPTVINLTNHSLFNLSGEGSARSALAVRLTLNADAFTPVDAGLIPTGELRSVDHTVFDFRKSAVIAERVRDDRDAQIKIGRGFDHNYALNGGVTPRPKFAARLEEPVSGRTVEILTTEPGVQLYTGNFLGGTLTGKSGKGYRRGDGVALETEHFPDSPNQPAFPSTRLDPGQTYRQLTIYRISVSKH
jgi:aldose 1-epimerase